MKWDERFTALAKAIAHWSKDPRTHVGAVLTRYNRVIGTGFNGLPVGIADDYRLEDKDLKNKLVVHAEVNAIIQAGGHLCTNATLYVTHPPCVHCAGVIIQAGIGRVVVGSGALSPDWAESSSLAQELLAEAGVEYDG